LSNLKSLCPSLPQKKTRKNKQAKEKYHKRESMERRGREEMATKQ
jgi:hypothetical protein